MNGIIEGRRVYVTTAIDYANGPPHLGHAFEKIGADAAVRYLRLKNIPTRFAIGMDEHGLKVLQSAESAGITPQEWVDDIAARFRDAWRRLGISNDDFIRTTELRHHRAVTELIGRMGAAGDLYVSTYAGFYCVGCEAYKGSDELVAAPGAGAEAVSRKHGEPVAEWVCPIHPTRELLWYEEENWFFRLSRYQERLLQLLDERPEFVQPDSRRNEIRRVIEGGLEDISVSRSRLPWGVPWPEDPQHTVYVWIDALTNYLSAIGFPDERYLDWWPAGAHVIGKDITRFHCVYWPAMLLSAGIEPPVSVWAHGFAEFQGRKMSKSEGVTFELGPAIERYGPDALRYYLLREVPWSGDGEVSWERFDERYTADLANDLGNLANRSLTMIERYREGVVPAGERTELDARLAEALVAYRSAMDSSLLHNGAAAALELVSDANGFIEARAPWKQARDPDLAADLDGTLASLARTLVALASLLHPFMPAKMEELARSVGLEAPLPLDRLADWTSAGTRVRRGEILFPRPEVAARAQPATAAGGAGSGKV
ncbi:MAG TPA: methionine--tRNA ligase [Longimicrobiales bacterium]|nr:methionine--tRNA ligase [Longimicrobiales bacterium]